jgi:aminoglycoside phosphotransferase family enzyme
MECDRAGASSVGSWLFDTYGSETGDRPSARLLAFHKCARAMLRAKLAIWHLDSPRPRTPEKWPRQARAYLELARAYAADL